MRAVRANIFKLPFFANIADVLAASDDEFNMVATENGLYYVKDDGLPVSILDANNSLEVTAGGDQSANTFVAGPTSGSADTPSFRTIVIADIATALTTPGPIGGTTPGSGAFSTLSASGNFAIATNKFTVAASSGNTVIAGTLAVTLAATFTAGQQSAAVAITATTGGGTTGIIPNGTTIAIVTSSVNTKSATLPTPTPGNVLFIYCGANGYNLISNAPATVAINGGSGSGAKLAVAATDLLLAICTSATTWQVIKIGADGTPASAGAAA